MQRNRQYYEEKEEFFNDLHRRLADKYGVYPDDINTIRTYSFHRNLSRKEIVFYCAKNLTRDTAPSRIARQQRIINFLASCSDDAWMDVIQRTPFDKSRLS